MTSVIVDFAGWMVPVPPRLIRNGAVAVVARAGSAVLTMAALMSATLQSGFAWRTSAAAPALCGEDMDVPERISEPLPLPELVEMTDTPGAVTSGFRKLSPLRGP